MSDTTSEEDVVIVNATIVCETQAQAVTAMESLSRAGVGLALEGLNVQINACRLTQENEGEQDK